MLSSSKIKIFILLVLLVVFSFSTVQAAENEEAKDLDLPVYNVTQITEYLKGLPEPDQKIPVAVYQLFDRTGQFLELEDYTSQSTAISQGATDMLINSLLKSGQFTVADRSILNAFMTEQDLKAKKKNGFNGNSSMSIHDILESKYIITGAITEYGIVDTGGTKLKVDGKGFNSDGVIAYAAIDLRVVDSSTNEVVYTVSLKDSIQGKRTGLDALSFFGESVFVDFESGKGFQEPINLVVRGLIDAAVYDMSVNFFAEETGIKSSLDSEEVANVKQAFSSIDVPKTEKKSNAGFWVLLLGVAIGAAVNK
ncbi:MAG: curli production assembly/transport component CsgG [Halanaerobiales bacterium]|nr:curli production assembly/transport component CsgG [Halanaerobiales bacterium]